jgi:hypothetical protein
MKNRELIEKLMQFDENAEIAAQVVDMQGNAWNLGLRVGQNNGIVVIQMAHPYLVKLPELTSSNWFDPQERRQP